MGQPRRGEANSAVRAGQRRSRRPVKRDTRYLGHRRARGGTSLTVHLLLRICILASCYLSASDGVVFNWSTRFAIIIIIINMPKTKILQVFVRVRD